ncbi:MAG TPA: hypothetical protein VFM80_13275 [Gracilimonas sp.]|uniref:hypothetical protein n=1 Tax=Gracilimonas sp. TaxID=1974203 RepID=UPI002D927FFE|nr:hypothetical protein [Gracilimonas sp.]
MNLSRLFIPLTIFISVMLVGAGCNVLNSDDNGPKEVAVTMQVQTSSVAKFKAINLDSLTEIKLLVEELELESVNDDSADFEVEDLIVNLPLDGSRVELTSHQIPAGLYDEFEMEIENDDDGTQVDDPDFRDGDDEYSLVIKGIYNGEEFMFRSDADFEIEMDLNPPLEISSSTNSAAVAINIDPAGWFTDNQGNPLDPTNPANKEIIENNIENSFEAEGEEEEDNDDDDDDDDD